jgi:tRNA 2-thiouridine synthesizing protein A
VTEVRIASTIDARGLVCPLPTIKLSAGIKSIPLDAVVELLATDPGSVADLEAFEKQTGHRVVDRSQENGVFRFLVRRTK